jgi:hypothetical protein
MLDIKFDDDFYITNEPEKKQEQTQEKKTELEQETEQEPEKKIRRAGRQKGGIYTKTNKYRIQYFNKTLNDFESLGDFPTLRQASDTLKMDYNLLSNININRSKSHNKYIRVLKI